MRGMGKKMARMGRKESQRGQRRGEQREVRRHEMEGTSAEEGEWRRSRRPKRIDERTKGRESARAHQQMLVQCPGISCRQ